MIDETKDNFTVLFNKHLDKSYDLAKSMLKIGKNETSVMIDHQIKIVNSKPELITNLTLLPIRRIYKTGDKLTDDDYLTHEITEVID